MVNRVLSWIDQKKDRPFFVVGWTTQTHHPYQLSPGQNEVKFCDGKLPREVEGLNSYLNCIAEADRQIGRLIDGIKSRGLADDTLIVITGDHGEAFEWPHDVSGHGLRFTRSRECPLHVLEPRLFPTGSRLHTVGGHIDLNPTVLDLLQLQGGVLAGAKPFVIGPPATRLFLCCQSRLPSGCSGGQWKYIYNATVGVDELYDLSTIP